MNGRESWLARTIEEAIDPELLICDPHHHLWEFPDSRYLAAELLRDIGTGHRVAATVFIECDQMYRTEGPGALIIKIPRGPCLHAVEVQPVQRSRRLVDQLKILGCFACRDELARLTDETHVQASHVAGKRVVRAVRVDRLPRAVGRVVVAEPLHGPRARHDEGPKPPPRHALDLEGHAVPQALGIRGGAGAAQRSERQQLDRAATDPLEVGCQRLLPNRARVRHVAYLPRTVSTGQGAAATTREATLPRKNLAKPVRPWVPMTIRSAFFDLAARAIWS